MITDLNDTENTNTLVPIYTMSIPHSKLNSKPYIKKLIKDEKLRIYQLLLEKTNFTEKHFQKLLQKNMDLSFMR